MTAADPPALLEVARDAAAAAAAVALSHWHRVAELVVEEKAGPSDLVSAADRDAERAALAVISGRRPEDGVLAEESGQRDGTSGICWVVDPIDGTTSFLYGRADWAVSIAAMDGSQQVLAGVVAEPVLGRASGAARGAGAWSGSQPVRRLEQEVLERTLVELNLGTPAQQPEAGRILDALMPAVRDVRRGGSAAAALARVATGRADAAWLPGLAPWDCAAGVLLVSEAGGVVGDRAGRTPGAVPASGDVLAAPPALWEPLRQLIAGAAEPRPS